MNDLAERQTRYLRDELPVRLGNLASTLAHIGSYAKGGKNPQAVLRLLGESRFFIEWTAADTDVEVAAELVEMQVGRLTGEEPQHTDDGDHGERTHAAHPGRRANASRTILAIA